MCVVNVYHGRLVLFQTLPFYGYINTFLPSFLRLSFYIQTLSALFPKPLSN